MKQRSANPPRTLSAEAKTQWSRLVDCYAISDAAGLLLVSTAMEALDRMRQAQALIAEDGPVQTDDRGMARAHPAVAIERDSRSAMLASLKALHLDLEPLNAGPGRPPGDD